MKVALVHDYIKEYGGAESVLETLSDLFPDAPIFTSLYQPRSLGPHRSRLEKKWSHRIHQSFFRFLPFASNLISPLRLLSPLAFGSFDFSGYDLIISSATGAYFPNSLNKRSASLVCYCHTPPRYLYGLATARDWSKNKLVYAFARFANHFLRLLDFKYAQNVDCFIANSSTTAARIKKFYRRDSIVINPPVCLPDLSKIKSVKKSGYLVTGGRLARAKRYDVAIQACNKLKLPLKVFGRDFAGSEAELKTIAGSTVEFLGEISESQKWFLLSGASAFIFCSDNEDFGIAPVEAMACGCPVVAYKSGGVVETVIDGQTGVFFNELTSDSCLEAIQKISNLKIDPDDCIKRAAGFSSAVFIDKINDLISSEVKH
ncbi:MAG TPA: glycosyltransferase [Patescibacteria group bacterium]